MPFHFVPYLSDTLLWLLTSFIALLAYRFSQKPYWRDRLHLFFKQPGVIWASIILVFYLCLGLLDGIHYSPRIEDGPHYSVESKTVLDKLLGPLATVKEYSYVRPWGRASLNQRWDVGVNGLPKAHHVPVKLTPLVHPWLRLFIWSGGLILWSLLTYRYHLFRMKEDSENKKQLFWHSPRYFIVRQLWVVGIVLGAVIAFIPSFGFHYHLLGTNKVGVDVLYLCLKSIHTGLFIGLTTLAISLPLAIGLGLLSGYWGSWVDDIIQYLYTTVSAIPGILLIVASVLASQVWLNRHPQLFSTLDQVADIKLTLLCIILGLTGWVSLCRLIRAEVLKYREMDYVLVAKTLGLKPHSIMSQHILPALFPLILITALLDFSGLILAEAVLTYVGVGVDPGIYSWGNMINSARFELARQPVVWWPLVSAFFFMLLFVFALNFLGDAFRRTEGRLG